MDDKKKKKFTKPETEIIEFTNNDIITLSNGGDGPLNWGDYDNGETA